MSIRTGPNRNQPRNRTWWRIGTEPDRRFYRLLLCLQCWNRSSRNSNIRFRFFPVLPVFLVISVSGSKNPQEYRPDLGPIGSIWFRFRQVPWYKRSSLNKIPTYDNLVNRGVNVSSNLSPLCRYMEECTKYLFFSYTLL